MRHWLTRKRILWLGIGAVTVFLFADGFVAGPAHAVHTPGATPLAATLAVNDSRVIVTTKASESISDLRCQVWRVYNNGQQCQDDLAGQYFPSVTQAPKTLYVLWAGCTQTSAIIVWQGYNLEFLPISRRLVLHCYEAEPWIATSGTRGMALGPSSLLLAVPTGQMGPGAIQIIEDDRFQHLVGDQSNEFQLTTATIS